MPLPLINWKPQPASAVFRAALGVEGSQQSALIKLCLAVPRSQPCRCLGPAAINQRGVSTQVLALGALLSAVPSAALIAARMLESSTPTRVGSVEKVTAFPPTSVPHSRISDPECPGRTGEGQLYPSYKVPTQGSRFFQLPSGNWNWQDQHRYHSQTGQQWIFFHCALFGWTHPFYPNLFPSPKLACSMGSLPHTVTLPRGACRGSSFLSISLIHMCPMGPVFLHDDLRLGFRGQL